MKEIFIRRGTQHEVRATVIARRGLKKLGFTLQKPRTLTEPLIIVEDTDATRQAIKKNLKLNEGEGLEGKIAHILNGQTGDGDLAGFVMPSSVHAVVNQVEKDGKTTYEIDVFQTKEITGHVSGDQMVLMQEQKQE